MLVKKIFFWLTWMVQELTLTPPTTVFQCSHLWSTSSDQSIKAGLILQVFGSIAQYSAGSLTLQAQEAIPLAKDITFSFTLTNSLGMLIQNIWPAAYILIPWTTGCLNCMDQNVAAYMTAEDPNTIYFTNTIIGTVSRGWRVTVQKSEYHLIRSVWFLNVSTLSL